MRLFGTIVSYLDTGRILAGGREGSLESISLLELSEVTSFIDDKLGTILHVDGRSDWLRSLVASSESDGRE